MDEAVFKTILDGFKNKSIDSKSDHIDEMTKGHHSKAMSFYKIFQDNLLKRLEEDLEEIKKMMHNELGRTVRKLESKIKGNYLNMLSQSFNSFYIEPFISKEIKDVQDSISKLKERISEYIGEFCNQILNINLKKEMNSSLFHFSNHIVKKSFSTEWFSVTSKAPLKMAEIEVSGFNRPETTWLALGVSKKLKQYGPVKKNLAQEDFMGNIYLNGSNTYDEAYRLKKDLNNNDVFIIESKNRMVWVYRKNVGKNKKETFIMDDNQIYYFYIAMRGPIQMKFQGQ